MLQHLKIILQEIFILNEKLNQVKSIIISLVLLRGPKILNELLPIIDEISSISNEITEIFGLLEIFLLLLLITELFPIIAIIKKRIFKFWN